MRDRQFLYCDKGALAFLYENSPKSASLEDDAQEHKDTLWKDFFKMAFRSRAVVHVDYSGPEFYQEAQVSVFKRQIFKRHANGECSLVFDAQAFPKNGSEIDDSDAAKLSSVFFISDEQALASFLGKGIYAITTSSFFKESVERYGCDKRVPSFKKGEPGNWNFFKKACAECNSLIIADLYLHDCMENNLLKILDFVLPKTLDVDFHLTVFTAETYRSISEVYCRINEFLKKHKPNLPCRLSVFKALKSDFHSRCIITNQMWLDSDGGFDLLKKDKDGCMVSQKTADVSLWHPFFSGQKVNQYNDSLSDVKKIFDGSIHEGEPVNRLFSLL